MHMANCKSFSIDQVVVPDFEFQLGSIMYLGFPVDIDLERLREVFVDKIWIENRSASVVVIKHMTMPEGPVNITQLCESLGIISPPAIDILRIIGVTKDQPLGSLGFSQLKLLRIAAALETDTDVIIYDTCGSDPVWAKRIDDYIESRVFTNQQGAIKIVYPIVFNHCVNFRIPTNAPFLSPCTEEHLLRAAKGSSVEEMLKLLPNN